MAIVTHERITRGGLEIGVSKLFSELYSDGDLTPQELARFSYAAWEAPECNAYGTTEINIGSEQGVAVSTQMSYFQAPIGGDDYVSKYVNGLIPSGRLYAFNVILYTSSNYEFITTDNAENVRLITDIDLSTCAMTLRNAPSTDGTVSIDYPEAQTITKYTSNASQHQHNDDLLKHWDSEYNYWRTMSNIHPFCIIANDSGILFITHGSYFGAHEMTGFGSYSSNLCPFNALKLPYGDNIINQKWNYQPNCDITDFTKTKHLLRWVGNDQSYEPQIWASGTKKAAWNYDDNFYIIMEQTNQVYGIANDQYYIYPKTLNTVKRLIACVGLNVYIGNDKTSVIKPIIEGGLVVGYSEDASTPSEIDTITNVTGNNISPFPPGPGPTPSGDDFDDHEMGAGSGISGMANLWLLTKAQLDDLHGAFNSAPGGFDPMNSLISVMGLGVAPTYLFDDIEFITPINIRKSDGTSWSTGVEGHIVDSQKSAFQFTGITVNRMYNNFLDYSPYAIHEIFIPMCGWLTLPDIAVDRSITVTYLPDSESLKCRAVVSVVDNSGNRCVIGEKDGIMGADVPFTNTGHSLYVGEAIINGMNVAGEVITGAIGAGFTKTNAKGGTYRPYEGFTVGMGGTLPGAIGNAIVSGQTNRTHYMTGNGTRIGFSDGENIQIKSTYHNIDKPTNYDHTVGKVCNKTGLLSSFNGFTVCDNPHINISALEEEKSEIKALLEQGVILPSDE